MLVQVLALPIGHFFPCCLFWNSMEFDHIPKSLLYSDCQFPSQKVNGAELGELGGRGLLSGN